MRRHSWSQTKGQTKEGEERLCRRPLCFESHSSFGMAEKRKILGASDLPAGPGPVRTSENIT
jgi:hypothetical protein